MTHSIRSAGVAARLLSLTVALTGLLCTDWVRAQDQDQDPPTRAARIGYLEGTVSFEPAGTDDWVFPPLNRPMTTGDQLWADQDGRAELQLDGSVLRVGAGTAVSFLNLTDSVTQIQLSSGTLLVRVRRLDNGETYEIDTPNLAFNALQPGTYRISVDAQGGTTSVLVRRGQGQVTGGGVAYSLAEGDADTFAGNDLEETAPASGYGTDSLDAWSEERDARWDRSPSARYVSPDVVGYEDLDDQGSWTTTPQYGAVWIPRGVDPGWAPYTAGHWAYVPPWGYTWVDDRPWGFAPFHYGRWVHTPGGWGWIPAPPRVEGAVYVRPVYAPALVAWVGAGAAVAWFALGPREVFVPSYPVSRAYMNNVNISNTTVSNTTVTNIYNTTIVNKTVNNTTINNTTINYVNRSVPGAVVATSTQAFSSGAPVARNRAEVSRQVLASAPVRAMAPPVVPTRQAVIGAARVATVKPPASVIARPVVARTPPPAPPPSFEQRQKAIQSNGGRPLSMAQVRHLEPAASARPAVVKVAPPPQRVVPPKAAVSVARPGSPARPGAAAPVGRPAAPAAPVPAAGQQRAAEQQRAQQAAEQQRAQQAAEQQRAQQQQAAERARQAEQERAQQAGEQQRVQQQQAAERARQAEQQRAQQAAEQQRAQQQQAAERARQAEQERAQQAAEQQRAQQQQAAERARQAEQQRAQQAAEQQRVQQQQAAERARQAEQQRAQQAAEQQRVQQQQAAERARQAEQQRAQQTAEQQRVQQQQAAERARQAEQQHAAPPPKKEPPKKEPPQ